MNNPLFTVKAQYKTIVTNIDGTAGHTGAETVMLQCERVIIKDNAECTNLSSVKCILANGESITFSDFGSEERSLDDNGVTYDKYLSRVIIENSQGHTTDVVRSTL